MFFYEPITSNYFKDLLYQNKKTTYFDRINNLEESEFEFDTPANKLDDLYVSQELDFKSYLLNCL